jgi:hypothetical protein
MVASPKGYGEIVLDTRFIRISRPFNIPTRGSSRELREEMVLGDLWIETDSEKVQHGRQRFDPELLSALGQSREPEPSVLSGLGLLPGDFVVLGSLCLIPAKSNVVFGQFWIETDHSKVQAKGRQLLNRHLLSALERSRELDLYVLSSLSLRPGDFVLLGDVCLIPVRDSGLHLACARISMLVVPCWRLETVLTSD